jgi:hypothetical protein
VRKAVSLVARTDLCRAPCGHDPKDVCIGAEGPSAIFPTIKRPADAEGTTALLIQSGAG